MKKETKVKTKEIDLDRIPEIMATLGVNKRQAVAILVEKSKVNTSKVKPISKKK